MTKLLLSRNDVCEVLGISLSAFNRRRAEGRMIDPVPGFAGDTFPRWSHAEIVAWVGAGCPDVKAWRAMNGRPEPAATI